MKKIAICILMLLFSVSGLLAEEEIRANDKTRFENPFSSISSVKHFFDEPNKLKISLFELTGDNLAVNGTYLVLHINQVGSEGIGFTWDLNQNIYSVNTVDVENGKLIIKGIEDWVDGVAADGQHPISITIRYFVEDGKLLDRILLEKK
jgi:hypothetical protein